MYTRFQVKFVNFLFYIHILTILILIYIYIYTHTRCKCEFLIFNNLNCCIQTHALNSQYSSKCGAYGEEERRRWEDDIKMDLQEVGHGCMDWIEQARDTDRWRALVNAE